MMPSFAVKRRPPQSALTRSTDCEGARFRIRPSPHAGQAGGSFEGAKIEPGGYWAICSAKIRLTSDEANPLSRSWNQQADGDGCVGSHLDAAAAGSRV